MNLRKDTSAPLVPFWSPVPVLFFTPHPFSGGGVYALWFLPNGSSLASSTSCSPFAAVPPSQTPLRPCPDELFVPALLHERPPPSLVLGSSWGRVRLPSSAPQCCDAPHPQKKSSSVTKPSCSRTWISGTILTLLQTSCSIISKSNPSWFRW